MRKKGKKGRKKPTSFSKVFICHFLMTKYGCTVLAACLKSQGKLPFSFLRKCLNICKEKASYSSTEEPRSSVAYLCVHRRITFPINSLCSKFCIELRKWAKRVCGNLGNSYRFENKGKKPQLLHILKKCDFFWHTRKVWKQLLGEEKVVAFGHNICGKLSLHCVVVNK